MPPLRSILLRLFPPRIHSDGALLPFPRLAELRACSPRRARGRMRAATGARGTSEQMNGEALIDTCCRRLLFFFSPALCFALRSFNQKLYRCSRRRRRQALHGPPARRPDCRRRRPGLRPGHGQEGEFLFSFHEGMASSLSLATSPLKSVAATPRERRSLESNFSWRVRSRPAPLVPVPSCRALSKGATSSFTSCLRRRLCAARAKQ